MYTAVIALALTVLGGYDEPIRDSRKDQGATLRHVAAAVYSPYRNDPVIQTGPAWFKIVEGKKIVREVRPQELPGLVKELGWIKRLLDNPRLMDKYFKNQDQTELLTRRQNRIEELICSDLPLGRFVRVGIAP
jgi:hypothetical protein